jgi:hypothetical protein
VSLNRDFSVYSYKDWGAIFKLLSFMLFYVPFSSRVILGDMRTVIFKIINTISLGRKNIALVDDGLYLYPYLKNNPAPYENLHFYTNLPIQDFVKSKVTSISKGKSAVHSNKNTCVFIGSKLVEFGLCELEAHVRLLSGFIDYLNKEHANDVKLLYIPHREESKVHLSCYEALGFEIKPLPVPIELYEKEHGPLGNVYSTFYSSALYNLAQNRENFYYSIKPLSPNFWKKNKINIDLVYELFLKIESVNVIEM